MDPLRHLLIDIGPLMLIALKATLVVAVAALACAAVLRRASAALRHAVWAAALIAVLVLPLLALLPAVPLRVVPGGTAERADVVDVPVQDQTESTSTEQVIPPGKQAPTGPRIAIGGGTTSAGPAAPDNEQSPIESIASTSDHHAKDEEAHRTPTPAPPPVRTGAIADDTHAQPSEQADGTTGERVSPALWLARAWLLGVAIVLLPLAAGLIRLHLAAHDAYPLDDDAAWLAALALACERLQIRRPVRLMISGRTRVPVTFGLLRPAVMLPPGCDEWPPEHRMVVLLHELGHVARRDWAWMLLSRLAVAVHWFNPLVRFAARRLDAEAERAADDMVLSRGCAASTYATYLYRMMCIDRTSRATAAALPMGRGDNMTRRLQMILHDSNDRRPMNRRLGLWTAAAVTALALPLGLVQLAEAQDAAPAAETTAVEATEDTPQPHSTTQARRATASAEAAEEAPAQSAIDRTPGTGGTAQATAADNPLIGRWQIVRFDEMEGRVPRTADGNLDAYIEFGSDGEMTITGGDFTETWRYRVDTENHRIMSYTAEGEHNASMDQTYAQSADGQRMTIEPEGIALVRTAQPQLIDSAATARTLVGTWTVSDREGVYEGAVRFNSDGTALIWNIDDASRFDDAVPPQHTVRYTVRGDRIDFAGLDDGKSDSMTLRMESRDRMYLDDMVATRVRGGAGRTPAASRAVPATDPGAMAIATDQLERRVSVQFEEIPLSEVVSYLRDVTGVNVVINTRRLDMAGASIEDPVTLILDDVPARTVLNFAIELISDDITWDVREGVVVIE